MDIRVLRERASALVLAGRASVKTHQDWEAIIAERMRPLQAVSDLFEWFDSDGQLDYFGERVLESGELAVDTETTGLDTMVDKVVGVCLYTPSERGVYVPVNHLDVSTLNPIDNQCSVDRMSWWFRKWADEGVKFIFHHAKFDLKMINSTFGVMLPVHWDTQIAASLLNENEVHQLKVLWSKYCRNARDLGEDLPQSYKALFGDAVFSYLSPELVYIYGARDSIMTYDLYKFQEPFLTVGSDRCEAQDLRRVAELYHNVELPLATALVNMELAGININEEYGGQLAVEYMGIRDETANRIHRYFERVIQNRDMVRKLPSDTLSKLGDTVNINSPKQLAIIFYDILKFPAVKSRSTDSATLEKLKSDSSLDREARSMIEDLLTYREYEKLINTYIVKLPNERNKVTGKIHCLFNQNGAATGRLCISKGSLIGMPRDRTVYPHGVPIEEVKTGDWVYSYDDYGELSVKRVLWAGKTGTKKTIRIRWHADGGPKLGHLELTPEHQVRLVDGSWKAAGELVEDDKVMALFSSKFGVGYGGYASIVGIDECAEVDVYDLEVEDTHCFIANDLAVHNSSSNPNMQNVPAHRREIRYMFVPSDGCVFVGGDYSQIEPRALAQLSQDPAMVGAYSSGKDLYATMASAVYNLPYESCLEKHPDGSPNPDGKKRRTEMKSVLLGIMYGRGGRAISEQLNISVKAGDKIVAEFFRQFPRVKDTIEYQQEYARTKGYVQTLYGRKRRLGEISLEPYVVYDRLGNKLPNVIISGYVKQLKESWTLKRRDEIIARMESKGWKVVDNTSLIAHAERQCLNSILQGTSADITKMAIVRIDQDIRLRDLGFHALITVHDEIIGECPRDNAIKCLEYLKEDMIGVVTGWQVPIVVDGEISAYWGGPDISEHNVAHPPS